MDSGLSPDVPFRASFFVQDLVIAQITKGILSDVKHLRTLSMLRLDQIALLLGAHLIQAHSDAGRIPAAPSHGLEAWQKLRSEELMRCRLDGNISIAELAKMCQLSPSYFARCFRISYGVSVHQFLIGLRLEKAKELLLSTSESLSVIALQSGFYDQAALTKRFRQVERVTPSRWRRINSPTGVHVPLPEERAAKTLHSPKPADPPLVHI